jgi:carbonic anhydrase/acetyltransferase-like protein (isoleucine patch superfamily)
MAMLVELDGVTPTIGNDVWLAPTAVLIGDVRVGDRANVWFGAVLRGDLSHVEVGEECSIQDNSATEDYQQLRRRYLAAAR